jgi:acyl-ACP thioesterase
MTVADREEVERLTTKDQFAIEGLIDELTILQWDPVRSGESSRKA